MTSPEQFADSFAQKSWLAGLQRDLDLRREQHLLRELRQIDSPTGPTLRIGSATYLQFCTNNYLGLANDPEVIAAAQEALHAFGTGAAASRLVAGSLELHHQLETELARFKKTEAAVVFSTGYMANLAVLTTFAGANDLIVSDKLNHASLLDAARFSGALHRTFPHRQVGRAKTLLERPAESDTVSQNTRRKFLVSDSVFSMDGDLADLPALCTVAQATGSLVILDEAHATGVLGERGAGLAELQHVEGQIALTVGTLSKALGSVGGFVAGPKPAIETLINNARAFIYTTALPPACSAAALAALKIVTTQPWRRQRVMSLAAHVKAELQSMGYDCGNSASPIIPVILGDAARALAAADWLRSRGLFIPAIRPPTVPPRSARLRISLMATHSDEQIAQLLQAMRDLRASHRQ